MGHKGLMPITCSRLVSREHKERDANDGSMGAATTTVPSCGKGI